MNCQMVLMAVDGDSMLLSANLTVPVIPGHTGKFIPGLQNKNRDMVP